MRLEDWRATSLCTINGTGVYVDAALHEWPLFSRKTDHNSVWIHFQSNPEAAMEVFLGKTLTSDVMEWAKQSAAHLSKM